MWSITLEFYSLTFLVLTDDWYAGVLARLHINAFRIERIEEADSEDILAAAAASIMGESIVGSAVYILPSMYNHNCGMGILYLVFILCNVVVIERWRRYFLQSYLLVARNATTTTIKAHFNNVRTFSHSPVQHVNGLWLNDSVTNSTLMLDVSINDRSKRGHSLAFQCHSKLGGSSEHQIR